MGKVYYCSEDSSNHEGIDSLPNLHSDHCCLYYLHE